MKPIEEYDKELDTALRDEYVLKLYVRGDSVLSIAAGSHLSVPTVHNIIRRLATVVRDRARELCEERFLQQDAGLQVMIKSCMARITDAAGEVIPVFDKDAVSCLIKIYDRMSKLHGMDKGKVVAQSGLYAWLDTASQDDLIRVAKTYGIQLPEPFGDADE